MDPTKNHDFKKLLKNININNFLTIFKNSVIKLSPIKNNSYQRNVSYTIDNYIYGIIDVLKNFSSWNSYIDLIIKLFTFQDHPIFYQSYLNLYLFYNLL